MKQNQNTNVVAHKTKSVKLEDGTALALASMVKMLPFVLKIFFLYMKILVVAILDCVSVHYGDGRVLNKLYNALNSAFIVQDLKTQII